MITYNKKNVPQGGPVPAEPQEAWVLGVHDETIKVWFNTQPTTDDIYDEAEKLMEPNEALLEHHIKILESGQPITFSGGKMTLTKSKVAFVVPQEKADTRVKIWVLWEQNDLKEWWILKPSRNTVAATIRDDMGDFDASLEQYLQLADDLLASQDTIVEVEGARYALMELPESSHYED